MRVVQDVPPQVYKFRYFSDPLEQSYKVSTELHALCEVLSNEFDGEGYFCFPQMSNLSGDFNDLEILKQKVSPCFHFLVIKGAHVKKKVLLKLNCANILITSSSCVKVILLAIKILSSKISFHNSQKWF